ncbi:hypothetical protein SDC9_160674 [bioreactor metagenome]|uniref:Uncharacterized protein n=1 Tax=bioreactor metagenome TaxID=1076179 RepID=A0A645FMC6_9ZZZZ
MEHQAALHPVDILKFIHQQMIEAAQAGNVRFQCLQQQIVQIPCVAFLQGLFIRLVQRRIHARPIRADPIFYGADGLQRLGG